MYVPPFHPWRYDRYYLVEFSSESKYQKNVAVMELGPYMHFATNVLEYTAATALLHPSTPLTLCPKKNVTATTVRLAFPGTRWHFRLEHIF